MTPSMPMTTPATAGQSSVRSSRDAIRWLHPQRISALALVLAGAIYGLTALPGAPLGWLVAAAGLCWLASWTFRTLLFIDGRIQAVVGSTQGWPVHTKIFPLYKLVDIYRATDALAGEHPGASRLHSLHMAQLAMLLAPGRVHPSRRLATPTTVPRKVSADDEVFVPSDTFWLLPGHAGAGSAVVRVWHAQRGAFVHLEVAARRPADASRLFDAIGRRATEESIYRRRTIRVVFSPEVRDSYDDDESTEPMDLVFVRSAPIPEEDIILDDAMRALVDRSVVDFFQRRRQLTQLGLPGKRGVLFYGPPGTGKTYTCKYISQRLADATTLVVTGHALLHMKAVCALAHTLQPALVLLEDVDLVFSHRETNGYNTVLGEFIDQLDGFGEQDEVIFILTTNALERIETAIKDRPGRVSQCIFFGPPNAALRQRYLARLLAPYEHAGVTLRRVVERTDGVSQAFLKELVFRAVQIATARDAAEQPTLTDADLDSALHDMTSGSGRAAHRIIGFRVEADG